ncbi:uncharacterized protein TNCV_1902011 [Trichonephila clavipes]|nr:uncharacterized protein TNCV_1902011 [Trichonephila clavipes]
MKWLDDINMDKLSKRCMLSTVHKVFDYFGFLSPVMLCPTITLQKAWKLGTSWDEELTEEKRLKSPQTFKDDHGIICLKTTIICRKASEDFLRSIVLPPKNEVVKRLIYNAHAKNCHVGVQI